MLRRLIKYDMKAISRIAVPICIASWVLSLLCCAVLYFTFSFAEKMSSVFNAFMITGNLYLICFMAISVMISFIALVIGLTYYKSVFTDEGYLNMLLPVTRRAFLNSKIISSTIWSVAAALTAWSCVVASFVVPVILYDTSILSNALDAIKSTFGIASVRTGVGAVGLGFAIAVSVLDIAKDVMVIIGAVTLGSVIFKRIKLMLSLVFYFVITFVERIIIDTVKMLTNIVTPADPAFKVILNLAFEILIIIAVFAIMYYLSLYFLEKKLNID